MRTGSGNVTDVPALIEASKNREIARAAETKSDPASNSCRLAEARLCIAPTLMGEML